MSDDEIPAYDDPYPTPAMERINAECQARIDAHYEGKAQVSAEWVGDDITTVPDWAPADTGAITVPHRTRGGCGIIGRLTRRTATGTTLEVVK